MNGYFFNPYTSRQVIVLINISEKEETREGRVTWRKNKILDYCKRMDFEIVKYIEIFESDPTKADESLVDMFAFMKQYKRPALIADKLHCIAKDPKLRDEFFKRVYKSELQAWFGIEGDRMRYEITCPYFYGIDGTEEIKKRQKLWEKGKAI